MGYSISVKFKNKQQLDKMDQFLSDNADLLQEMNSLELYTPSDRPMPVQDDDLGYKPKVKNLLGFNVRTTPKYIWDLCAWMAVKTDSKDKEGNLFFYYDHQKMKITFDINNKENTLVDSNGINIFDEDYEINLRGGKENFTEKELGYFTKISDANKKVNDLFFVLNDRWNEFDLQYKNPPKMKMK